MLKYIKWNDGAVTRTKRKMEAIGGVQVLFNLDTQYVEGENFEFTTEAHFLLSKSKGLEVWL